MAYTAGRRVSVTVSRFRGEAEASVATRKSGDLRVQAVNHPDGRRSFVILDVTAGLVHARADRFLAPFGEGTQRTYAYHLVDHLRWLAAVGVSEDRLTIAELRRYMALVRHRAVGTAGVSVAGTTVESERSGGAGGLSEGLLPRPDRPERMSTHRCGRRCRLPVW